MSGPSDHAGHRKRLRERFLKAGNDALADYEMLELVLFQAQARRDMKPVAKALMKRFGTYANVISARPVELTEIDGIGDAAITVLKTVQAAAQRLVRDEVMNQPVLQTGSASWIIAACPWPGTRPRASPSCSSITATN